MFRRFNDSEIDEFGVVTDRDTGLLIEFPVEEDPIQIASDIPKIKPNDIISLMFMVVNISDQDQIVYGITFEGIPDYLIYQRFLADTGSFDKKENKWLLGKIPAGKVKYLEIEYKYIQPLSSFELGYKIELI